MKEFSGWRAQPDGEAVFYEEYRRVLHTLSVTPSLMSTSPTQKLLERLDQLQKEESALPDFSYIVKSIMCKAFDLHSFEEALQYYCCVQALDVSGYIHSMIMTFYYALSWEQDYLRVALRELHQKEDADGLRIVLGLMARASNECAARKSAVFSAIINRVTLKKADIWDGARSGVVDFGEEHPILSKLHPELAEKCRRSQPLMQSCQRLFDACASHILDMKDKAFESTFIQPSLFYAALVGDEMLALDAEVHGGPTYLAFLQATLGIKISRLVHLTDEAKGVTDVLNAGLRDVLTDLWSDENLGKNWASVPACKQFVTTNYADRRRRMVMQPANQFVFPNIGYGGAPNSVKEYADLAIHEPTDGLSSRSQQSTGLFGMFPSSSRDNNTTTLANMRARLAEYLQQYCKYFREENILPRLFNAAYAGTITDSDAIEGGLGDDLQAVFMALKEIDESNEAVHEMEQYGDGGKKTREGGSVMSEKGRMGMSAEPAVLATTTTTSPNASDSNATMPSSDVPSSVQSHASGDGTIRQEQRCADTELDDESIPQDCVDARLWIWNFDEYPAVMNLARARRLFSALGVVKPKGWQLKPPNAPTGSAQADNEDATADATDGRDPVLPRDNIVLTAAGCAKGGGTGREFVHNLLNDGTENWNKWLHPGYVTRSWVQAQFRVPEGYLVTEYGLCSANDAPRRDPSSWVLLGLLASSGQWVTLHTVSGSSSSSGSGGSEPLFTARWQWRWYSIPDPRVVTSVKLSINSVQRPGDHLQLGHFHLRGRLPPSPLPPPPPSPLPLNNSNQGGSSTEVTRHSDPVLPPSSIRLSAAGDINGGGTGREVLANLLLDGTENWNKWLHPGKRTSTSWVRADFTIPGGYIITEYGLCSANDCPQRDPTSWTLRGQLAATGQWVVLHQVDSVQAGRAGFGFTDRWQWLWFPTNINGITITSSTGTPTTALADDQQRAAVTAVVLELTSMRAPGNGLQLGHFHLRGRPPLQTAQQTLPPSPPPALPSTPSSSTQRSESAIPICTLPIPRQDSAPPIHTPPTLRHRRAPPIPAADITLSAAGDVRGGGTGREFVTNLLLDGTEDWNKWLHPGRVTTSWVRADFTIPGGYIITEYGLCSANDCPQRDPTSWTLRGQLATTGQWVVLHQFRMHSTTTGLGLERWFGSLPRPPWLQAGTHAAPTSNTVLDSEAEETQNVSTGPGFTKRWQWLWFRVDGVQESVTSIRLDIESVRDPGDCIQLGHFHMRGHVGQA